MQDLEQAMQLFGTKFENLISRYHHLESQLAQMQVEKQALLEENQQLSHIVRTLKAEYQQKIEQYIRQIDPILEKENDAS